MTLIYATNEAQRDLAIERYRVELFQSQQSDDSAEGNAATLASEAEEIITDPASEYYYLNADNVGEAVRESSDIFAKRLAMMLVKKDYEGIGLAVEAQSKEYWIEYVAKLRD